MTITISQTRFVDFLLSVGRPKQSIVKDTKRQLEEGYNPGRDFWKILRDRIVSYHKGGHGDSSYLDQAIRNASEKRRERAYPLAVQTYKKFLGKRRRIVWFDPPKDEWKAGNLTVNVNPELGLTINDVPHVVKLYFKGEFISRSAAEMNLVLMHMLLADKAPVGAKMAILDVKTGRLHTMDSPKGNIKPLLHGEAVAFQTIWNQLG